MHFAALHTTLTKFIGQDGLVRINLGLMACACPHSVEKEQRTWNFLETCLHFSFSTLDFFDFICSRMIIIGIHFDRKTIVLLRQNGSRNKM